MIEMLHSGAVLSEQGDVLPPDDVIEPDIDCDTAPGPDEEAEANGEVLRRALTSDFTVRNRHLFRAVRKIGEMREKQGLAEFLERGGKNKYYSTPRKALKRAEEYKMKAYDGLRAACGSCALRSLCFTKQEDLFSNLLDADVRARFKNRVTKPNNNYFCAENQKPGRLPKAG